MNATQLRICAIVCPALLAAFGAAPTSWGQTFTEPVLIKTSPTNLGAFDVSWNDNTTHRYYLADRTNNAIDMVDSATDTFLGFIGRGHFTGSRPCPGQPKEMRHCAGPNGVVTDDLGHVWAGDGDGNIIEADSTKPGTAIIRSIPTGGKGRVDEMAYDPINRILLAENDGDSPPIITFVSVTDGSVLGHFLYPMDQDGMEQPAWVRQTGFFYQNVPGKKNRIDVFDPHKLPNPVKSFPVECAGGVLGLTVSGLTVGPNGRLMTVCGSVGGASIDSKTGKILKVVPQGADADEVWYDPGTNNYYFSGVKGVAVVSGTTEKFVANIPLASHSVAVNASNQHIFVPVAGKGIFVVTPKK
jgi:DNA-binding beta-propeller fold protein YncE